MLVLISCEQPVEEVLEEQIQPLTGWRITWQDEFEGDTLDRTLWNVADGHWSHNGEMQYYAPDEVYLEDGCLRLRSQQRNYQGLYFTSGHVTTKHYQRYGRVEIHARLPGTQGTWPAHWLLPITGDWPPEIDIVEHLGHEPNTVHMSVHWGPLPEGLSPWECGQTRTGSFSGPDFTADFHTFSLEWYPDSLRWLVDDVLRFKTVEGIPHEPMYLILNTAVGGFWPGSPNASSVFPQFHDIDYVRFYERDTPG